MIRFVPVLCCVLTSGCMQRTLVITSEPSGALVRVNDVEVGRTPVKASFLHYGTYDVRISMEGFEPIATSRDAQQPWYAIPPLDIVSGAMGRDDMVEWHFTMQPLDELTRPRGEVEADLLGRAASLRDQLRGER